MFDPAFSTSESNDDLPASNDIGAFCHAETPRPDTAVLLAELGMPAHQIRSHVASLEGIGADG